MALNEGIHLAAGSVTDLSGAALYDPRAPFLANGQQQRIGLMIGGGTISTASFGSPLVATGYDSPIDPSSKLVAEAGARINLNGASGSFDERVSQSSFARVAQWSDAGRLVIGNGALMTGAHLTALGGDDGDADTGHTRASGGILDWVAPTIRQQDDGTANAGEALFASQIMEAGFDSVIARGSLTTVGEVRLELGKILHCDDGQFGCRANSRPTDHHRRRRFERADRSRLCPAFEQQQGLDGPNYCRWGG